MGALAGQGIRAPQGLHPGAFLALFAGFAGADGALWVHTRIGMDKNIGLLLEMIIEDLFQQFDFGMAGIQGEITGQNQMEIHEQAGTGAASLCRSVAPSRSSMTA